MTGCGAGTPPTTGCGPAATKHSRGSATGPYNGVTDMTGAISMKSMARIWPAKARPTDAPNRPALMVPPFRVHARRSFAALILHPLAAWRPAALHSVVYLPALNNEVGRQTLRTAPSEVAPARNI